MKDCIGVLKNHWKTDGQGYSLTFTAATGLTNVTITDTFYQTGSAAHPRGVTLLLMHIIQIENGRKVLTEDARS